MGTTRRGLRTGAVMSIVAAAALWAVACGSDPSPASGSDTATLTATPAVLGERVALRLALNNRDGLYSEMVGEPSAVWGGIMTYGEARDLIGSPLHEGTSSYQSRDVLVWYFIMEGDIVFEPPPFPDATGATVEPDTSPKPGLLGTIFNAYTGGGPGQTTHSQTRRDLGQSQLPLIEVPGDIYETVLPTIAAAPFATAAPPATPAPSATPALPPPGAFERLLKFVPDTPVHRGSVRINDLAAERNWLGLVAPGPEAPDEELIEYRLAIALGGGQAGGPESALLFGDDWLSGLSRDYISDGALFRPYLGFDTRDIDQVAVTGEASGPPSQGLEIVVGGIDGDVANRLIDECAECVPHELVTYGNRAYMSWGTDAAPSLQHRLAPPAHDQFGRGGQILVSDGHAVRTLFPDAMHEAIDAHTGARTSLAEDDDFREAASAVDRVGAVSAVFSDQGLSLNAIAGLDGLAGSPLEARVAELETALVDFGPFPEFDVMASGLARNDTGTWPFLVLVFDDAGAADAGAANLDERIARGVLPDGASGVVTFDGRTVTLRLDVPDDQNVPQFILRPDSGPEFGLMSAVSKLIVQR